MMTLGFSCADRSEAGPGHDGGGQHSGVRLQLPPAVTEKQDPGRRGTLSHTVSTIITANKRPVCCVFLSVSFYQ